MKKRKIQICYLQLIGLSCISFLHSHIHFGSTFEITGVQSLSRLIGKEVQ